jgi:hypothetical protein
MATDKGQRNWLQNRDVKRDVGESDRATLRKQLREGARVRAERDMQVVTEWSALRGDTVQEGMSDVRRRSMKGSLLQ